MDRLRDRVRDRVRLRGLAIADPNHCHRCYRFLETPQVLVVAETVY